MRDKSKKYQKIQLHMVKSDPSIPTNTNCNETPNLMDFTRVISKR